MPKLAWLRLGLLAALFTPIAAYAQVTNPQILPVSNAPTGACTTVLPIRLQTPNGGLYTCQNGTWGSIGTTGGPAFSVPISAPDAVLKLPRTDVRWFGAVGDGTTDNCTALTNASTYAVSVGAVLYFPPSTGYFGTSCTIPFLGNWIVDGSGPMALSGGTAASTALISTGTTQTMDHTGIYGAGVINGNFLSPTIIWVMQGRHINISVGSIVGMAVNGKGVYFGDDAGVGAGGYEGAVYNVGFGFHTNATHTGSTGIYISGGNGTQGQFTDDNIHDNVIHGVAIGIADHVGGNNRFTNNHVWDQNLTTAEDEFANGGTFLNEYVDTPSVYGFHIRGTGTTITDGIAYNGILGNLDNVATAIQFDIPAEPQALISGVRIYGTDASHRWALDTNLGFSATQSTWCDMLGELNVVTRQQGNNCLRGQAQILFSGFQLKNGGTLSSAATTLSCNGTCAISGGGNVRFITLTGSVTSSTFNISMPSGATYAAITMMICQNATGGFTFAPPANSVGFGTISTTAGLCSLQNFLWDGTTLRASSPIQTNE